MCAHYRRFWQRHHHRESPPPLLVSLLSCRPRRTISCTCALLSIVFLFILKRFARIHSRLLIYYSYTPIVRTFLPFTAITATYVLYARTYVDVATRTKRNRSRSRGCSRPVLSSIVPIELHYRLISDRLLPLFHLVRHPRMTLYDAHPANKITCQEKLAGEC